jgi:hypothetical protein
MESEVSEELILPASQQQGCSAAPARRCSYSGRVGLFCCCEAKGPCMRSLFGLELLVVPLKRVIVQGFRVEVEFSLATCIHGGMEYRFHVQPVACKTFVFGNWQSVEPKIQVYNFLSIEWRKPQPSL